jgi:hypothetical protein
LSISLSISLSIPKTTNEIHKVLLPLVEGKCIVNLYKIATTIFKHLVNMGLSEDISFDNILTNKC